MARYEGSGKIKDLLIDYTTGLQTLYISLKDDFRYVYKELKECEKVSVTIQPYRKKRSLDANAYYWVLIGKAATLLEISNAELHNMMLSQYGQPEIMGGKMVYATIPDTDEAEMNVRESSEYHLQPTSQVREGNGGIMYRTYKLMRGSHTYNTKEMSRLIDGLISECKSIGMPDADIATPDEKEQLKKQYGIEL